MLKTVILLDVLHFVNKKTKPIIDSSVRIKQLKTLMGK